MRQLISLLTEQVTEQIIPHHTNIVRLEGFDNPVIYTAVCRFLFEEERLEEFVPKITREKYSEFQKENRSDWRTALEYLRQGTNAELLEEDKLTDEYKVTSFVDYANAMTKWRNQSALYEDGKTALILLMGTEAAQDTGGLADTSFAINPKKIIAELKEDYSIWFDSILVNNGIDDKESREAINTLYKAIFKDVNIDLIRLSYFVDSLCEMSFASAQELIVHICETLNDIWKVPKILDNKLIPRVQNLSKGKMKSAQIIMDAVNFIERTEDIPSQSFLDKLNKNFDVYAEKE